MVCKIWIGMWRAAFVEQNDDLGSHGTGNLTNVDVPLSLSGDHLPGTCALAVGVGRRSFGRLSEWFVSNIFSCIGRYDFITLCLLDHCAYCNLATSEYSLPSIFSSKKYFFLRT